MEDYEIISLEEFHDIKQQITAVCFPVNSFNLEAILRWLMDRKFSCDNFIERDGHYIFIQQKRDIFENFETRKLEGEDITIEIGKI